MIRLIAALVEPHQQIEQGHDRLQGGGDVGQCRRGEDFVDVVQPFVVDDSQLHELRLSPAAGIEFDGQIDHGAKSWSLFRQNGSSELFTILVGLRCD
jgi:hypothetical protein